MAQTPASGDLGALHTTAELGEKIQQLRVFADRNAFTQEEWRIVSDQTSLVYKMFEGLLPEERMTIDILRPMMSNICKGTRRVTEGQLRIIATKFKIHSSGESDVEPWEWLLDNTTTEEFIGELMRVGYGRFGRPDGNPFVDPRGPLAWLAPYRMVMDGLTIRPVTLSRARFDDDEFDPVQTLLPRSPLQIILDLREACYGILLAVYPRMPDRKALCLVPSPRVPDHRLLPNVRLPTLVRKGERAFRAPALPGTYLLIAILSPKPINVGWLARACAALYTPSITDLSALERELARHNKGDIEVRYLPFAVASKIPE